MPHFPVIAAADVRAEARNALQRTFDEVAVPFMRSSKERRAIYLSHQSPAYWSAGKGYSRRQGRERTKVCWIGRSQ